MEKGSKKRQRQRGESKSGLDRKKNEAGSGVREEAESDKRRSPRESKVRQEAIK